jgi:hypothetical protein
MSTAYIKIAATLPEGDAYTVFKSMRNTLNADKVEMETLEQKKDSQGRATGQKNCKVTGYFWAEVVMESPLEEVPSE